MYIDCLKGADVDCGFTLCVPMREQKNDEKGYFFGAGQCAALSSFRVGKMLFL